MPTVLISGANRGIGLEFTRQYSADGWSVIATARVPAAAAELRELGARVTILPLDVTDPASISTLAANLGSAPIDLLIANAGMPGVFTPPEDIGRADFIEVMAVNSFGPLALATALRPNLAAGNLKVAAALSSLMGSIAANDWGTQYVYRASKSALNVMWGSLALEWKPLGITCILLRPGIVKTRMTNFTGLEPEESVSGMRRALAAVTFASTGGIVGYDGKSIPW